MKNPLSDTDGWRVGDVPLRSRFLLGTAGYPSPRALADAIAEAAPAAVTILRVIIRRPRSS